MGKLIEANVVGADSGMAGNLPVQEAMSTSAFTVPDRAALRELGVAASQKVSLDQLVLHSGAEDDVKDALAYLRRPLHPREKSLKLFNIAGATGNGKTTLATALAEQAKAEGMHVEQFQAGRWLTRDAHTSTANMENALRGFVSQVREGVKYGKPRKGVIVINEAQMFAGVNTQDPETVERAGALNDLIDRLESTGDMQLILVLTSRLPLMPDLTARAAWNVEMPEPDADARSEALYRLLVQQVDQKTGKSDTLDDGVLTTVKELGTMTAAGKQDKLIRYLEGRRKGEILEPEPDMVWAENFFGLVGAIEGFSFRDINNLVARAQDNTRRNGARISYEKLYAIAQNMQIEVDTRHSQERREGTRR